jgi:hypothetical protein
MALYQGYDGGKINVNISGGSGVDKTMLSLSNFTMKGDIEMDGTCYDSKYKAPSTGWYESNVG